MPRFADMRKRLTPDTLRARLALTVLLTILLVLSGTGLLLLAVTERYAVQEAEERAKDRLSYLDAYLSMRTDRLSLQAVNYSEWTELYDYSASNSTPPAEWLDNEIADWLPLRSSTDVAIWTSADGRALWSMGEADDVAALRRLIDSNRGAAVRGRIRLSQGPAIVVALPITGFPPQEPAGHMVLAALVDEAMADGFIEMSGASALTVLPVAGPPPEGSVMTTAAFSSVRSSLSGHDQVIFADVTGWDGAPAGSIVMDDPDPVPSQPLYIPLLITLGAVGLAVAASTLLAVTTTRFVRRPVDELVAYVTEAVAGTVEGAPHEPLLIAPDVPAELRVMLEAVDGLSERLGRRQGELREALLLATEAEERLRIAVDDSPEAKLLIVDGIVRLANPAAAAQMGIPVDRFLGMSIAQAMGGRPLPLADSDERLTLSEVVERAGVHPVTVVADTTGRGPRWLEVSAVTHPGPGGQVLVTSRDVTEALRRDELRGEILGMVSHDLRSPLAVISGYVDILERESDGEVSAKAVAGARKGIDRMLELLEDLLTTARAEELFAPQTMAPVHLDTLVEEVAEIARTTARQEILVEMCCTASTRGEERRLRQALLNIVGNAVKYSPDDSRIHISMECANDRLSVIVEDEGPGIPEKDRERVFERFSRIERQEGRRKPGFGLGLYIVRAIVTGHGGSVRVEDTASGTGSRFVIDLPSA